MTPLGIGHFNRIRARARPADRATSRRDSRTRCRPRTRSSPRPSPSRAPGAAAPDRRWRLRRDPLADDVPAVLRSGPAIDSAVRVAHVRERHGPAGAPWRLAAASRGGAALDRPRGRSPAARRRRSAARPQRAPVPPAHHDARRALARGLRIESLGEIVDGFAAGGRPARRRRRRGPGRGGPRLRPAGPPAAVVPRLLRLRAARRDDVGAPARARSRRPGTGSPIFYFSNTSEIRGPGDPVWAPRGSRSSTSSSRSARSSTRPRSTCREERAAEAIGGYFILNDWSARDLQRDEIHGPPRAGEGQGLRDLDRALDRDAGRARRTAWPPARRRRTSR